MRVALLTPSGMFAAHLESFVEVKARGAARLVWTVPHPDSVLGALDHNPTLFLLDMQWREEALAAGRLLREAGTERILCLFDQLDDPLIPTARSLGFEIFIRTSPLQALLDRMLAG